MKMVMVVCPAGRQEEFRKSIEEHGIRAYTEIRHVIGEGETRKEFGSRIWPSESAIIFIVIEDDMRAEIERVIKECQAKLYPAEAMRAFVMPVENML